MVKYRQSISMSWNKFYLVFIQESRLCERAFSYADPLAWNSLPADLQLGNTTHTIARPPGSRKRYLFASSFALLFEYLSNHVICSAERWYAEPRGYRGNGINRPSAAAAHHWVTWSLWDARLPAPHHSRCHQHTHARSSNWRRSAAILTCILIWFSLWHFMPIILRPSPQFKGQGAKCHRAQTGNAEYRDRGAWLN